MEVVGHRVGIEFTRRAFLRTQHATEVAEVIDGQRQVGGLGFADRLAVVDGLDDGEGLEILFETVGDLVQNDRACGGRGAPHAGAALCAASRASSTSSAVDRATSHRCCP